MTEGCFGCLTGYTLHYCFKTYYERVRECVSVRVCVLVCVYVYVRVRACMFVCMCVPLIGLYRQECV